MGGDSSGRELQAALAREGVNTGRIAAGAGATTRSMVFLEPTGTRTIVNLALATVPLPPRLHDRETAAVYVRSADPALTPLLRASLDHCRVVAHMPPCVAGSRPAPILVASDSLGCRGASC